MDYAEKTRIFQQYIEALEEERRKIQVFHRELPLSFHLVSQAIESYRQQMTTELSVIPSSDCEETSSDGLPVLEEFIPLRHRNSSSSEKDEEEETNEITGKKRDWLKSVQLWNQEPDQPSNEDSSKEQAAVVDTMKKKVGGAFHPFHGDKKTSKAPAAAASSTAETNSGGRQREEKEGRKSRRCWSPELHHKFLQALQQLGGSNVATPKQIKELMKVDGLTNDEVKSHLQKYRLHTRRPTPAIQGGGGGGGSSSSTTQPPPPQFLVVGGIWVPPPEYAMATKSKETTPPVYAPVPTLPQMSPSPLHKEKKATHRCPVGPSQWKGGRGDIQEDRANSSSPTTSSSSHTTTTTSPAF